MVAVSVSDVSKIYKLYNKPSERLREAVFPFVKPKHREFYALKDINFTVQSGETVGIIGKNGSGKSTLLKILSGVLTQSGGNIEVNGRVSALLELGAGFNPEYTGIENIYLNGAIMGFSKAHMEKKIPEILAFADIGDYIHQAVKTYSSGMFVRLAFAVVINVEPDILVVDEALAVGDYRFQAKCYKKFEELKAKNKTILFVTHDVDAVRRFCGRAMWINEGSLIMDGSVRDVTAKYMEFITDNSLLPAEPLAKYPPLRGTLFTKEGKNHGEINRFGSDVGAIAGVELYKNGKQTRLFDIGDKVKIRMEVNIPVTADLDGLSVSVSVKDKAGLDLFVMSTFDEDIVFDKWGKAEIHVTFDNCLNAGEYFIAPALENRNSLPISYYDYIEGAEYFTVMGGEREYYGVVKLPATITVK